ncbi:Uncharacterised protein [Grimontia hollisae]|uniref:Uncharacterized protein n=1 Tax=Grimontia hollisae TaxID=673 RepID=A0A377HNI0_GRIHO|nr:Uncharacterised protein [Grimontia hollisae]STO57262.1 Uncharacterised protein [Grimontia hollisae]STQ75129.1 Uncharacterised protein [Grimontia hollisae]
MLFSIYLFKKGYKPVRKFFAVQESVNEDRAIMDEEMKTANGRKTR